MTWRDVLQSKGWTKTRTDEDGEWWRMFCDNNDWEVMMISVFGASHCSAWLNGSCFDELNTYVATDEAAFAALMAKPIGPGRVMVGVLLGVVE
jgi:hypothetical protein